ncbi:unnamed protein product [Pedinophyceae sp. YPF-701]|nr:unnamed protein product [Pedinophyceae sp. YPF-701]
MRYQAELPIRREGSSQGGPSGAGQEQGDGAAGSARSSISLGAHARAMGGLQVESISFEQNLHQSRVFGAGTVSPQGPPVSGPRRLSFNDVDSDSDEDDEEESILYPGSPDENMSDDEDDAGARDAPDAELLNPVGMLLEHLRLGGRRPSPAGEDHASSAQVEALQTRDPWRLGSAGDVEAPRPSTSPTLPQSGAHGRTLSRVGAAAAAVPVPSAHATDAAMHDRAAVEHPPADRPTLARSVGDAPHRGATHVGSWGGGVGAGSRGGAAVPSRAAPGPETPSLSGFGKAVKKLRSSAEVRGGGCRTTAELRQSWPRVVLLSPVGPRARTTTRSADSPARTSDGPDLGLREDDTGSALLRASWQPTSGTPTLGGLPPAAPFVFTAAGARPGGAPIADDAGFVGPMVGEKRSSRGHRVPRRSLAGPSLLRSNSARSSLNFGPSALADATNAVSPTSRSAAPSPTGALGAKLPARVPTPPKLHVPSPSGERTARPFGFDPPGGGRENTAELRDDGAG